MKKIIVIAMVLLYFSPVRAQNFQEEARVSRAYVWDIPQTDSLYTGIIPDTMRVVVMYTANATPIFVLAPIRTYKEIQQSFNEYAGASFIVGFQYTVTYVKDFSWLSPKQIRRLSDDKRIVAKAFNEKAKYTIMARGPRDVVGTQLANGNIIPNFQKMVVTKQDTSHNAAQHPNQNDQRKSSGLFSKKQ